MSMRPLADAVMATTVIFPQIIEEVMLAEHGGEPRPQSENRQDRLALRALHDRLRVLLRRGHEQCGDQADDANLGACIGDQRLIDLLRGES